MRARSNIICGLDIGTSVVSALIAEKTEGGSLRVLGYGRAPSTGLRKGVVINIDATVESIGQAVKEAEAAAGQQVSHVYASMSGAHIRGFNSHGVIGIKGQEVSKDDVEGVIEAARAVAIPLDRELIHVLPQEFLIDSQDGIRYPLGIAGVRLEARVHLVTGSVASAQNIVKCANLCGLVVDDIVLSALASSKAVLSEEEQELGVCLLDVGAGTTDIIVFSQGAVQHTSVLPVGGSHITNDIASGLRTPMRAAEQIKCEHGTAATLSAAEDSMIEVPSTGGRQARVISRSVLAAIIEPRAREMFQLVRKELEKTGNLSLLTSGIVLTGGASELTGIGAVAEDVFSLPTRVARPSATEKLLGLDESEALQKPALSTLLGTALYAADESAQFRGAASGKLDGVWKKVVGFLGQHL